MEQEFTYSLDDLRYKYRVRFTRRTRIYLKFKRCCDIWFSFFGLVILLPVFLVISVAIKIEDPSAPILYIQDRIGRKGLPFRLYKFRSMNLGAPVLGTGEFKDSASYITKVGRFIRHTSLDELPQLWNVLKGDMSLVGPRPLLPRERDVHFLRFYYGIYQIRPGITGMAQTHGRDNMNDFDKVWWDRKYAREVSLKTDCILLYRTFFKVIHQEDIADLCAKKYPGEAENIMDLKEEAADHSTYWDDAVR